jgi:hypothetical protein
MPLLAYVAIILVSLGGILFELNWLTSPKLDSKPAVQASTTAAPPKVADAAIVPRSETAPPRNVAPTVTLVPAASATAPAAVSAAAPEPAPQPTAAPAQQAGTAPALSPAPFGVANANNTASPSESTAPASTDFKREFTNETKAVETKVEPKTDGTASAATFTPAVASTPAVANAATPGAATSTNNKCDIASCSAAYQSFRAADCTYQPIDGTARKVCDRAPETAQRAAIPEAAQRASVLGASAPVRGPRIEAAIRKGSKDAELRAVEREVRRMTASEAALDPGPRRMDRSLDRSLDRNLLDRGGGSEVIMIERPNRDW